VAKADLFVHSFRPGVPESLGIDYETLRKIKPDLVYQYGASYGSTGPYSKQPAIDPIIAAFAGTTAYQAGEDNPPLTETGADPVAAAGAAAAMVIGLFARHRSGQGQYIEPAMIVSNIYLNCEDALAYPGKTPRPTVDHLQLGTAATHRLYETASADPERPLDPWCNPESRWIFLAAESDDEFARFCQCARRPDLLDDHRFASAEGREKNRTVLEAELEVVFATRTAQDWETSLLEAGVGCAVADAMSHFAFLYEDPQAKANQTMAKTEHPSFGGAYWRHAPMVRFSETPAPVRPHCEMGEHTMAILAELGFDEAEMTALHDDQVVAWPLTQAEIAATS
jgi:crotonobetainyl-CoA:carnitine CoA-transferase CaiB-like acyl-CoA transferase